MSKPLLTIKVLNGKTVMLNENDEIMGIVKDVTFGRPAIEIPNPNPESIIRHFTASPEVTMEIKYDPRIVPDFLKKIEKLRPFNKGDKVLCIRKGGSNSLNHLGRICRESTVYYVDDCHYSSSYNGWVVSTSGDLHRASDFKLADEQ